MNLNVVAGGVARLSDQFTGLFGDNGTSGLVDLLHWQMQLLQNIGAKLDAIKQELDLIVDVLLTLDAKVDALPARTALYLYRADLQGRMLDIDELIDALREESQAGSRVSTERLVEFVGRAYVEFRSARNRLFYLKPDVPQDGDMLVIPIVALCMHYEFICLAVTSAPASLRRVTRASYADYFRKWLAGPAGIEQQFNLALAAQRQLTATLKNQQLYNVCTKTTRAGAEPGTPAYNTYFTRLQRFARVFQPKADDADVRLARGLVARGLLTDEDLPATVTVLPVGKVKTYYFTVADGRQSDDQRAELEQIVTLDDGSSINRPLRSLMHENPCSTHPETTVPQGEDVSASLLAHEGGGRQLICLASIAEVARTSIGLVETMDRTGTEPDPVSPFGADMRYLFDLLGERTAAWQRLLTAAAAKADGERSDKLTAISTQWQALQRDAERIMAEYAAAEERVRAAASADLLEQAGQLLRPLAQAAQDVLTSIEAAHRRVLHDIEWNLRKAVADAADEAARAAVNIEVAVAATFDFIEAEQGNLLGSLDKAAKAVRQGEIVDAVWAVTLGRAGQTQDNLSAAVLQSSLLKDIAMSAASIYGGPYGAAAFTAWYTYRATGGDLEAALRAGVIAGLSASGLEIAKGIPYTELTRRTLATAVVGAAAVAAAGGSEQDIIRGFLTGTAFTLANAYYASTVQRDMDGRVATAPAINKFDPKLQTYYGVFSDQDGNPVFFKDKVTGEWYKQIDTNRLPARIVQVGIASHEALGSIANALVAETAIPMQALAYGIPMMNAMAAFHDRMCAVLAIDNSALTAITIIPAAILTVSASEAPLEDLIVATINGQGKTAPVEARP